MTQEEKNDFVNAAWLSDYEGATKLVLVRIAYFLRLKEGYADIGQDRLARYASCLPRQVRRAVRTLKADGVLNVQLVKDKKFHNRYTLNLRALAKHEIPLEVSQDLLENGDDDLVGPAVEVSQDLRQRSSKTCGGGLAGPKTVFSGRRNGEMTESHPLEHKTGDAPQVAQAARPNPFSADDEGDSFE